MCAALTQKDAPDSGITTTARLPLTTIYIVQLLKVAACAGAVDIV